MLFISACSDDSVEHSTKPIVKTVVNSDTATVTCAYVSDGDTWNFYFENEKYPVRVLNIDCFETSINDRLYSQAEETGISIDSALSLGLKAKSLADSLLKGNKVFIKKGFSTSDRDVYDRLLRKCYINGLAYDSIMQTRKLDVNTFNH